MTERQALLAAIATHPDDDTPRLVYADWLEEHREAERAEFVRDCCQVLARHTDCPVRLADLRSGRPVPLRCGACDYCSARRRTERFYARHPWMTGTPYAVCFEPTPLDGDLPTGPGITLVVSRGFVSHVRLDWQTWLRHADALTWHPKAPCPVCSGPSRIHLRDPVAEGPCDACHGSSLRPCPETVCPGLAVTLTEFPPYEWQMDNLPPDWPLSVTGSGNRYVAKDALRHRWPGVRAWEFEPAVDPAPPDDLPAYGG